MLWSSCPFKAAGQHLGGTGGTPCWSQNHHHHAPQSMGCPDPDKSPGFCKDQWREGVKTVHTWPGLRGQGRLPAPHGTCSRPLLLHAVPAVQELEDGHLAWGVGGAWVSACKPALLHTHRRLWALRSGRVPLNRKCCVCVCRAAPQHGLGHLAWGGLDSGRSVVQLPADLSLSPGVTGSLTAG